LSIGDKPKQEANFKKIAPCHLGGIEFTFPSNMVGSHNIG